MHRAELRAALHALLLVAIAQATSAAAGAAEPEEDERIHALERRVAELELALSDNEAPASRPERSWTDRLRIGGSANGGFYHRFDDRGVGPDGFAIRDARLFFDAELLDEVPIGDGTLVRNVGFSLEWNLVRLGDLENVVGDLYVDFQGIGGTPWANAQVGRFQIPVGEAYLRYGRGVAENPFVTDPVGGPWWWDEGVRLYGSDAEGRVGYVASVTGNDSDFGSRDHDPQGSLKLYGRPLRWLHLSASGLVSGQLGSSDTPANGALWLGETWARPVGTSTPVATVIEGAVAPPAPNVIDRTWLVAADVVATPLPELRLWLGWGRYQMDSAGSSLYDRALDYWIAELVLGGGLLSPALAPMYLGLRSNALTTGDSGRGYLLDVRYTPSLGYNMETLAEHSAVLGWWLGRRVVVRSQYSLRQIELVRGAGAAVASGGRDEHALLFDVGVNF